MYIGIDLGGTNIAAGIVSDDGKILCKGSVPTKKERDVLEIIKDMADLAKKLVTDNGYELSDIKAAGIGCPGTVDNENGTVVYANNLKMDNTPVAAEFQKYFKAELAKGNDIVYVACSSKMTGSVNVGKVEAEALLKGAHGLKISLYLKEQRLLAAALLKIAQGLKA